MTDRQQCCEIVRCADGDERQCARPTIHGGMRCAAHSTTQEVEALDRMARRASLPVLLTVEQTAALLRLNRKTVYSMVQRGEISGAKRCGRSILVHRGALMRMFEDGRAHIERDEAITERDILRGHLAALWVEVHYLRGEAEALQQVYDAIRLNAEVIPDPRMDGLTDCYAVPLDDIDGGEDG